MPTVLGIAIVTTSLNGSHTLRPHTHHHLQTESRCATDHLLKLRAAPAYYPTTGAGDCRAALSNPPAVRPDSHIQVFLAAFDVTSPGNFFDLPLEYNS